MAATVLRFRRSLTLTCSILIQTRNISSVTAPLLSTSNIHQNPNPNVFNITQSKPINSTVSFQFITSRSISSRSRYNNDDMDGDQISPDAILFEGCDYNHWLITMDFPKDPKPSPEEMVETYVQTAAKVLGSVEEAKKKIYACSTTTYNGFQVEVSEEVSEQFKAIPGVVFVLPDSYIDPVNKEYGGDKYINGTIIPRPPPVQYGRQGGRYNDRNRDYNRPPPRGQMEQNNAPPGGQGSYQGDRRGPVPSYQTNYNQGRQADFPQRDQGNFTPSENSQGGGGGSFRQAAGGQYGQGRGGSYGQGGSGQLGQTGSGNFGQGAGGQFGQGGGGNYGQGTGGHFGQTGGGNYGQGAGGQFGQGGSGSYGQGTGGQYGQGGGGSYGQGSGAQYGQGGGRSYGEGQVQGQGQGSGGQYGQVSAGNYGPRAGGQYGQGSGGNYGQGTGGQYGENQRFSQVDQRSNIGGQQRNYEVTEEADAFKES